MNRNPLHQEIAKLRAQLDEANETIRQMKEAAAAEVGEFYRVAGLTKAEARIVATIAKRGRAPREALMGDVERNTIAVQMCRIRRKLAPYCVTIKTLWRVGYEMDRDSIENLRRLAGLVRVESPSLVPEQVAA